MLGPVQRERQRPRFFDETKNLNSVRPPCGIGMERESMKRRERLASEVIVSLSTVKILFLPPTEKDFIVGQGQGLVSLLCAQYYQKYGRVF